jgi:hypothetical protein
MEPTNPARVRVMTAEQKARKQETDRLYKQRNQPHVAAISLAYYHEKLKADPIYIAKRKVQYERYSTENKEALRAKGRAYYKALKDADPTFRCGKRGRPRKVLAPGDALEGETPGDALEGETPGCV